MEKITLDSFCGTSKDKNFDIQKDFLSINVGSLIDVIYELAQKCEKEEKKDFVSLISKIDHDLPRESIDIDGFTVGSLLEYSNWNFLSPRSSYFREDGIKQGNNIIYLIMVMPFFLKSILKHETFEEIYEKLESQLVRVEEV